MILDIKEVYPIHTIDGNCVLGENGDITFCFSCSLPEKYSLGEKDFDRIFVDKYRFYSMLPSNTVLHNQHFYLDKEFEGLLLDNTFMQKATNKHFKGLHYVKHFPFVYITLTNIKSLKRDYLKSRIINSSYIKEDLIILNDFTKSVERAVAYLNSRGYIYLEPLTETEVKNVALKYITGFNGKKLTDIEFKPKFKIGDNHFKMFALVDRDNLPKNFANITEDRLFSTPESPFYKGFFEPLGLDFGYNHVINQILFLDNHKDNLKELEDSYSKLNTFSKFNRDNEHAEDDLKEYLDKIYKDDSMHLIRSHINILTWSKDVKELDHIDNRLVAALQGLDITPYYPTRNDHAYYFLSSIPTNAGKLPKQETFNIDLKKAICFDITESRYKSDSKGVVFNDRISNLPVVKDDWDEPYRTKQIASRNAMIICETGGGKTFLLNHLARQYMENGDRIILIDLGGSFELLSLLFPDDVIYIRYKEGEALGLNPFHIDSRDELTTHKIVSLTDFVSVLWFKGDVILEEQRVSLSIIIEDYYNNFSGFYSFPTFYNYVKTTKDLFSRLGILEDNRFFDIASFLHVCSQFTTGIYKSLFKENSNAANIYKKRIVIYQLDEIRQDVSLLPVVLMSIRDVIDNKVHNEEETAVRVFFEEAAEHMKQESMLRTIDFYNQTIRKYDGQVLLVLQTIDNIPDTILGKAIINNCHIKYILSKISGDYRSEIERLKLSEHVQYLLASLQSNLKTEGQKYTEFLYMPGSEYNVFRLETPPEANYVYLSEKNAKKPILADYKKTSDIEKTVMNFVNS